MVGASVVGATVVTGGFVVVVFGTVVVVVFGTVVVLATFVVVVDAGAVVLGASVVVVLEVVVEAFGSGWLNDGSDSFFEYCSGCLPSCAHT